jgi:hypothetical protein
VSSPPPQRRDDPLEGSSRRDAVSLARPDTAGRTGGAVGRPRMARGASSRGRGENARLLKGVETGWVRWVDQLWSSGQAQLARSSSLEWSGNWGKYAGSNRNDLVSFPAWDVVWIMDRVTVGM